MSKDANGRGVTWPRFLAVAAVVVLAGVAAGVVLDPAEPGADEIVDGVEERYDGADSYTGVVVVEATYDNGTDTVERTARVRVQYKDPGKYRVDGLGPEKLNGTVAATNGSVAWASGPGTTPVVESLTSNQTELVEQVNVSAALDRLQEDATISKRTTTTLDGEETYVLDVVPKNESYTANATVWVDTDDYRVHKIEAVGAKDGKTLRTTMRFESFDFGVSIHDSTFKPPADRAVVSASLDRTEYDSLADARANVDMAVETPAVPSDYAVDRVLVSEQGERATLLVTYENESDQLAVVQSERDPLSGVDTDGESVTLGNATGQYQEISDTGVVYWTTDTGTSAVVGSSDRDTLVSVAQSIAN